jgi:type III secretory pathway component EscU
MAWFPFCCGFALPIVISGFLAGRFGISSAALWIFLAELDFLFEHLKSLRAFQMLFFTSGGRRFSKPLL